MPLIFLDTPQIDLLEKTRRTDPVRYSRFRDAWKGCGYTLVFTLTQAGELCRYADAPRREGRYQVLADLVPIRTDFATTQSGLAGPQTLFDREILRAMVERGLITAAGPGVARLAEWTDVLPGRLDAGAADHLRATMENQEYRDLENQMYDAARIEAAAEKASRKSKSWGPVGNLPTAPLPEEKALACRAALDDEIARLKQESGTGDLPPIPEDSLRRARDSSQELVRRAQEIGVQAALLERLRVVGTSKPERLRLERHDLANRSVFEGRVRVVARELLGASDREQEFLARMLDFADCPGSWLNRRLRLCVERGSSEPEPGHHNDTARLAYLPYVDLLFTDGEMAEFVQEVMRDKSTPERIRALRPPVAIPNSLEALEAALH